MCFAILKSHVQTQTFTHGGKATQPVDQGVRRNAPGKARPAAHLVQHSASHVQSIHSYVGGQHSQILIFCKGTRSSAMYRMMAAYIVLSHIVVLVHAETYGVYPLAQQSHMACHHRLSLPHSS